ncbi:Energy-coupling factor transporter ATP-binding protein EcfA [Lentibacillus sp. JNUCC-1]|uniref:ABC transporter ATP-binding protein n=1 Tax=Lentibacillus sp. JNUCC-1 TaxID=2654513 RepID=UPI0012E7BA48|nr:energy-coupling factor transporter ATPase [Lentibacillus sp. JNUCC-1]MUV37569.1 Energy-coupling factor transporter ATP-binding protein EcfA [Lentibacillus sp. JNUCC-1]
MDAFNIDEVTFFYPDMDAPALKNVSLRISEGTFTVVCGPSGCGKTTLLRLLKQELAPAGLITGQISYFGTPLADWDEKKLMEEVGLVFQDPDNQIVMDDVMQELVFAMENLGYDRFEMRRRVAEMVHFFGMEAMLDQKPSELSGGQKQMLNLLSVLLLKPSVLLLDEPTSQLDPIAAKELITMLERLNEELGMTIVLVEHRLEELFSVADKVVMMDKGTIAVVGPSREVIKQLYNGQSYLPYIPTLPALYLEKSWEAEAGKLPLTVKDTKAWLNTYQNLLFSREPSANKHPHSGKSAFLELDRIFFQYGRHAPLILKNLSLKVGHGDYLALVGGNGSGKTTLLKACIGMIQPQRGTAKLSGKPVHKLKGDELSRVMAYLPQNPRTYFLHDTVRKEMAAVLADMDGKKQVGTIAEMASRFELQHLLDRHPYDLSGGEMQKAALACMLLGEPDVLLIDEPTKGLDPAFKQQLADILKELNQSGLTIVMVTHDIEFAAEGAHTCAMLFDGEITAIGTPAELFKGNYFYTTAINRATRNGQHPGALTLGEAVQTWQCDRAYS